MIRRLRRRHNVYMFVVDSLSRQLGGLIFSRLLFINCTLPSCYARNIHFSDRKKEYQNKGALRALKEYSTLCACFSPVFEMSWKCSSNPS